MLGLFLVLEYTRVPSLIPVLGVLRSQLILLVVIFIMWLSFGDRVTDPKNPIVRSILAFAFLCGLSITFTPNTRTAFNMMTNILTYTVAIVLPLLSFVKTVDRLKWFLQLFVAANTFIAFWAITHGGMGPGGFISDENDCALVLNVAMPFAAALVAWPGQKRLMRWVWAGCGFLLLFGSIATPSRGGFVGIVACGATMFWFSRNKMKVIGSLVLALAILIPLAPVILPPRYIAEVESIDDPNDGTRQNRIYFWKLGWMMYKMNPVLGVGAGNYPWTVTHYEKMLPPDQLFRNRYSGGRPAHSLYFTLLPELGTVGVIVFGSLVYFVIQSGRRTRLVPLKPRIRPRPGTRDAVPAGTPDQIALDLVGRAIIASCIAYLGTGAFISVLYYPSFWHLCGIAAALGSIHAAQNQAVKPNKALKSGARNMLRP
jgi:O-antigen ligase